jgi:RNA polymerase sigma factor (sigma-70 family)
MGLGCERLVYRERRLGGQSVSSLQLRPAPNPSPEPSVSVGRLFEEYSDRIYGFCLRRLVSPADAEDAVQMTFLCAHRAVQRGVVPESEQAWLFAIAKNVCRWQQRTNFRRNRLLTDAELDALASPSRGDDEGLLVGLKEALASIPESQRRALVLREWHGLSSSEVAGRLGMSQPATYALLTRARRSLAHALTALPQQAALGLVALVYEARSHLKALFGGSAAVKTAAATTIVAAVAVGGVTVERAIDGNGTSPSARRPGVADVSLAEFRTRARPGSGATSGRASTSGSRRAPIRGSSNSVNAPTSRENPVAGESSAPASSPSDPDSPSQLDDVRPNANSELTTLPDAVSGLAPLPELLPVPELPLPELPPLPTDLLPPVPEPPALPAPSLPPVDLPPPPVEPPAPPPLPDSSPLPNLLP